MEETTISTRPPARAKGGRLAVTMTAATLRALISLGFTVMPRARNILLMDCVVNAVFPPSPVPFKPTTRPYPINWLSRTPAMFEMSLTRAAWTRSAAPRKSTSSTLAKPEVRRAMPRFSLIRIYLKWPDKVENTTQPAWALLVSQGAATGILDVCIGDETGWDTVVRANILRANHPADDNILALAVNNDLFGALDIQVPVWEHFPHYRRNRCAQ